MSVIMKSTAASAARNMLSTVSHSIFLRLFSRHKAASRFHDDYVTDADIRHWLVLHAKIMLVWQIN